MCTRSRSVAATRRRGSASNWAMRCCRWCSRAGCPPRPQKGGQPLNGPVFCVSSAASDVTHSRLCFLYLQLSSNYARQTTVMCAARESRPRLGNRFLFWLFLYSWLDVDSFAVKETKETSSWLDETQWPRLKKFPILSPVKTLWLCFYSISPKIWEGRGEPH